MSAQLQAPLKSEPWRTLARKYREDQSTPYAAKECLDRLMQMDPVEAFSVSEILADLMGMRLDEISAIYLGHRE